MRTPLVLILFCLLLLPAVGSGQGIRIKHNGEYALPRNYDSLFSVKSVKSVSVFNGSSPKFLLHFERNGKIKMIEKNREMREHFVNGILESRFGIGNGGQDSTRYFYYEYQNKDTTITISVELNFHYALGELINRINNPKINDNDIGYYKEEHQAKRIKKKHYKTNFKADRYYLVSTHKTCDVKVKEGLSEYEGEHIGKAKEIWSRHPFIKKHNKEFYKTNISLLNREFKRGRGLKRCGVTSDELKDNYTHQEYTINKKGLHDSLVEIYFPMATGDEYEELVKTLKDHRFDSRKIRSKTPEKKVLYTFRYEYFDE